jgi:hypothetical protein
MHAGEWVGHVVCGALRRPLIADLRGRMEAEGRTFEITKLEHMNARPSRPSTVHVFFDLGGLMYTNGPREIVEVQGLRLRIPSDNIASMISDLNALPERRFANGLPYYKLHGFMRALVLSPAQREVLLVGLRKRLPEAEASAQAFYAEHEVPSVMLRKANARVHGVDLEKVPNLGANRQDRFQPKKRGLA